MSGFPAGGVLLADVRVSFVDPSTGHVDREIDGVQKVHVVAPNLAIAFSGSVKAGLTLSEEAKRWFADPSSGTTWSPEDAASELSRRLKRLWPAMDAALTQHGFQLLLVGAVSGDSPTVIDSTAFRFRAPDFDAERLPHGHAFSIGSGSDVATYMKMIESFAKDHEQLSAFSLQPFPAGPAGPMSVVLGELIAENPEPGISSQLVLCTVGATETSIYTVRSPRPELHTPPIAATLEEFHRLCSDEGLAVTLAIGSCSAAKQAAVRE
jgi:hypothetical protein